MDRERSEEMLNARLDRLPDEDLERLYEVIEEIHLSDREELFAEGDPGDRTGLAGGA